MKTLSIIVTGKVQGVWYRQGTREKAISLGITGVVRNEPDGSVFIIATGTDAQLEDFISWCRQGPPRAQVNNLEVKDLPLQHFDKFVIER
ncbi:MAG TPA: acylphosphatase [Chitinophagaceae bacterium]|nr:acylphosphatase [Chitinophagaceae bacterium]